MAGRDQLASLDGRIRTARRAVTKARTSARRKAAQRRLAGLKRQRIIVQRSVGQACATERFLHEMR